MERKAGLGWRPDRPDYRDYRYGATQRHEILSPGALPDRAFPQLREVMNHGILDQGQTGSCTGHGMGLVAAVERNVTKRSPYFIYYEARRMIGETDVDNGAYIRDAAKVVGTIGSPNMAKWPSKPENLFADPVERADIDAAKRKVFSYHRLQGGNEFRSCLAAGHLFAIGFSCYANLFDSLTERTGVIRMPQGGDEGGHCVAIIGYQDDFRKSDWYRDAVQAGIPAGDIPDRIYMGQNSWGEGWGRNGWFVIPAEYLEDTNLADDAWTLRGFAS